MMDNTLLEKHRYFIRQRSGIACSRAALENSEIDVISHYGAWFEAMADRKLELFTDAQRAFVEVHRGKSSPRTTFERIWKKYQCQRIVELATKLEASLANSDILYEQVHRVYLQAANLGVSKASAWLVSEGSAEYMNWTKGRFDLSVPIIRALITTNSGSGSNPTVMRNEFAADSEDWSNGFDDRDAADWESYGGGTQE